MCFYLTRNFCFFKHMPKISGFRVSPPPPTLNFGKEITLFIKPSQDNKEKERERKKKKEKERERTRKKEKERKRKKKKKKRERKN